jgi:hypothetical protein
MDDASSNEPESLPTQRVVQPEDIPFIHEIRTTKDSPNVAIPDDTPPQKLLTYLRATTDALGSIQDAVARLKPFIGRILLLIKQHPEMFAALGYRNFDHWMTVGVPVTYGVSRPEAYACVRIAEMLAFLPAQKMQSLGIGRLNHVAQALRKSTTPDMPVEMIEAKRKEWVAAAENRTVRQLKELIVVKNLADKGDLDPQAVIAISVNRVEKKRWEETVADPAIQEHCESKDPGVIFTRMMDETVPEWYAQEADKQRAAATGNIQAD